MYGHFFGIHKYDLGNKNNKLSTNYSYFDRGNHDSPVVEGWMDLSMDWSTRFSDNPKSAKQWQSKGLKNTRKSSSLLSPAAWRNETSMDVY